jgi:hypothetical protein
VRVKKEEEMGKRGKLYRNDVLFVLSYRKLYTYTYIKLTNTKRIGCFFGTLYSKPTATTSEQHTQGQMKKSLMLNQQKGSSYSLFR